MKAALTAAILLLALAGAQAHRLDEYLQETLISVEKDRVRAEITLTPGVAVLPIVMAAIDGDADGIISESEQRAYASRVLRELSLSIDGHPSMPRLISIRFPGTDEMKEGLGAIRIEFYADLPRGGPSRSLIFANRHQSKVGAYMVNCLAPKDPEIRIVAQNRNYSQSVYRVDYVQNGVRSAALSPWPSGEPLWAGAAALLLLARLAFLWRERSRSA